MNPKQLFQNIEKRIERNRTVRKINKGLTKFEKFSKKIGGTSGMELDVAHHTVRNKWSSGELKMLEKLG